MAVQKHKKQDLIKLRDELFIKVFECESDEQKLETISEIVSLSKKIGKRSDDFKIWISKPAWDEENDGPTYAITEIY